MEFDTFAQRLRASLPEGTKLENPGGGTSTVLWCDGERVSYRRGKSRFYVSLSDLYSAYMHFAGGDVTTRELKDHAPGVFDSTRKGHNCNCTFLFLALQQMGLTEEIWGRGRSGAPFGVTLGNHP